MKSLRVIGAMAVASTLSCCAATPESIAPAYVSEMTYHNWSCQQLAEEEARLNVAYASAAAQQNNARTNDTIGVIFLGLPVSSMSGGNVAPQIANLKGQQDAVRKTQTLKNCSAMVARPVPAATPAAQPSPAAPGVPAPAPPNSN